MNDTPQQKSGGRGLIQFDARCTKEGKPFVVTIVDGEEYGQLDPQECLRMGVRGIQAAIEAERDAALVSGLRANGAGEQETAAHLKMIRHYRSQVDPNPEATIPAPPPSDEERKSR